MRIVFVQTGDFAEAFHRFAAGEPEAYRDQKTSVDFVASLAATHEVTTVCTGDTHSRETLAHNLNTITIPRAEISSGATAAMMRDLAPDRLILRSPFLPIARLAKAQGWPTLPSFADLFQRGGPRSWLRHHRMRSALSGPRIPCVANHSLNASRSVVDVLGLPQTKVVPWDWSKLTPNLNAKTAPADPTAPRLFYAGVLSVEKGVGDCLHALRLLHDRGLKATLSLAGKGDLQKWRDEAQTLGLSDAVTFLGLIANTDVRTRMAEHDMIVVPSRSSYPEGLPNTIYEALASRSALILSDHPAFAGRIAQGVGAAVFRGGDPVSLADEVCALINSPGRYAALSKAAPDTLNALYIGVEWSELIRLFLDDPTDQTGWVAIHALPNAASGQVV
jgi:glycosyltransferase involved in cell wall biosynthesis